LVHPGQGDGAADFDEAFMARVATSTKDFVNSLAAFAETSGLLEKETLNAAASALLLVVARVMIQIE
jgi:hypothetical protein